MLQRDRAGLLTQRMLILYCRRDRHWRSGHEYQPIGRTGPMFARWGAFVYRFRRPVVLLTLAIALGSVLFASRAAGELSSGGWLDKGSESAGVIARLDSSFASGRSSFVALFHGPAQTDATSPAFQAAIATSIERLKADARVVGVIGFAETGDRQFISTDGHAAYAVVQLNLTNEQSVDAIEGLRAEISPPASYSVQLTGYGPIGRDQTTQSEADLQRAETVSAPLVLVILVAVFASLIAAGMPLLIAGLAIPTTLGLVYFVAQRVEMSIYVLNISTMLGLALAIDYSLFIVSRFREELARGRSVGVAVEKAVATSGKAVAFSGFAVAVGLSGLLFMKAPALNSIGIGGSLVVLSFLLAAGTPFLRVRQAVPGAEVLPAGLESRDTYVALQQQFPRGETTPITVLADVQGDPTSQANALALARYAQALDGVDGIDRVESPFSLRDPATGALLAPEQIAAIYAQPANERPAAIQALLANYVRGQ